jgi:hypothetical protein
VSRPERCPGGDGLTGNVSYDVDNPVALELHGLGVKFGFAEHGLSPYWGVVAVYEPDHDETLDPFEAVGETWEIEQSTHWSGQLAPPPGNDGQGIEDGLNEYQYQLRAADEAGDKDLTLQFRPGYPDAENVHSGEPIQGIPDDYPESIRVQAMSTNLDTDELLPLVRAFAEHVGLNPDYFRDPHEYSTAYQIERYARLDREVAEARLTGDGGVLDQLADFGSAQSGRGMYKWDHEDVQAHYEAVAMDPETWALCIPGQELGKQLKVYHPQHVRDADADGPLAHPKIEVSLSSEYDPDGTVPWSEVKDAIADLDAAAHNVLSWADVSLSPDADAWVTDDPYFAVEPGDAVTVQSNPLPDLREGKRDLAEAELLAGDVSDSQFEALLALTDGGSRHYEALAEDSDTSSSTIYRLLDRLSALLDSENGIVQFADDVTRDHVQSIVEPLRETADWASDALRQAVDHESLLGRRGSDGEPSALEKWLARHGIDLVDAGTRLHLKLGRPVSRRKLAKILRAGLDAAAASGLESDFREALIDWQTPNGDTRRNRRAFVDGLPLGREPYRF